VRSELVVVAGIGLLAASPAFAAKVAPGARASSEQAGSDGKKLAAALAFDGLLSTGWSEGAPDDGAGAWIELTFDKPVDVGSVSLYPGYLGGADREIREYGRPKLVTLTFTVPGAEPVVKQERLLDPGEVGPLRHDVMLSVPGATGLKITFDEVFSGGLYSETRLAEVVINLVAGDRPQPVVDAITWLQSDDGQKEAGTHREQAVALFEKVKAAEFGDRPSFETLMSWAADGAPYLRDRASKLPMGFRLAALQPDKTSIEALLKLKDANAIPAIERAAIRLTGDLAKDLSRRARLFDAYTELGSANIRNVPPWGQEGIAKGQLRSFGAPLEAVADAYGNLYVADTGNHRVQQFGLDTGVVGKVWGAKEPDVAEVWFYGSRDAYAAGARPGEGSGEFVNPADLAVVYGKDGDTLFVLDARGRLSEISPDGAVVGVRKLPAEGGAGAGEVHVVADSKQVVTIFGNEGWVWSRKDPDAEPVKFELAEGPPSSAVLFSNGKLGLVYGSQLVMYSTDGFRFGDLLGESLGSGYENWAVTLDEKGRLWAVLDTGEAVKFKKPGKVDFRLPVADYSLVNPRIAVYDDHVFVVDGDRIAHVDALEAVEQAATGKSGTGQLDVEE
jgi:hypothetical protein